MKPVPSRKAVAAAVTATAVVAAAGAAAADPAGRSFLLGGRLNRPSAVVALVVAQILARFHPRHPSCVRAIPVDGRLQTPLERHLRFPSGFTHQLLAG